MFLTVIIDHMVFGRDVSTYFLLGSKYVHEKLIWPMLVIHFEVEQSRGIGTPLNLNTKKQLDRKEEKRED